MSLRGPGQAAGTGRSEVRTAAPAPACVAPVTVAVPEKPAGQTTWAAPSEQAAPVATRKRTAPPKSRTARAYERCSTRSVRRRLSAVGC